MWMHPCRRLAPACKDLSMAFKKARIAPTPSGFLHVGNIFSFSLTTALARKNGASILLRIDDLDRERVSPEYVEDIFETLRFLGIPWDEGPADAAEFGSRYSQLHRMGLYREALRQLKEGGVVFACACSRSQLLRAGVEGVYPGTCRDRGLSPDALDVNWRLRTEPERVLRVKEAFGGIGEAVLPPEMRDFVVRKKDGFPAYQLTSLVDDLYYGVDLVVRGDDLWPSTLAQHYLSYFLDGADFRDGAVSMDGAAFREVSFYHHPLLVTAAGEKLSKSAGATSIHYLRKQGYGPADIYSLIGRLLGWEEPVRDWESLATLLFVRGRGAGR
jgi:glutamyl/glutaminyl-tRNA synthetase